MEKLARKIRREETLYLADLKNWVNYNFLVFEESEQDEVKKLLERQQKFMRRMQFMIPPIWCGSFAIMRYQYKFGMVKNFIFSTGLILGLTNFGLFSSNKAMKEYYDAHLYPKYKDEVLLPKYRGLKLTKGKKAYQIDDKGLTSSNFDDLKEMIFS